MDNPLLSIGSDPCDARILEHLLLKTFFEMIENDLPIVSLRIDSIFDMSQHVDIKHYRYIHFVVVW